jgi:hypothetical protein
VVPFLAIALEAANAQAPHHEHFDPRYAACHTAPGFTRPAHWTNEPAPAPHPAEYRADPDGLDPTRFGDWEKNGIAIDF